VRINETTADELRVQGIEEQALLDERRADAIRALLNTPLNVALQLAESGEALQSD
jgi:hypothetical protein